MGVRVVFLSDYPLVLSLLKHKGIMNFWTKKMRNPNNGSSLNSNRQQPHCSSGFAETMAKVQNGANQMWNCGSNMGLGWIVFSIKKW